MNIFKQRVEDNFREESVMSLKREDEMDDKFKELREGAQKYVDLS